MVFHLPYTFPYKCYHYYSFTLPFYTHPPIAYCFYFFSPFLFLFYILTLFLSLLFFSISIFNRNWNLDLLLFDVPSFFVADVVWCCCWCCCCYCCCCTCIFFIHFCKISLFFNLEFAMMFCILLWCVAVVILLFLCWM